MKIKAVVLGMRSTSIKEGKDNGWNWFKDPARNILLLQLRNHFAYQDPCMGVPIDEQMILSHTLLRRVLREKNIDPHDVLFVFDRDEEQEMARLQGFRYVGTPPSTDQLIRHICLIENFPSPPFHPTRPEP